MNNRQRSRRAVRLRQSPGWPPARRRRPADRTEGTTPATPPTETPDDSPSETA